MGDPIFGLRARTLENTVKHLTPHRVTTFKRFGVDLIMTERQGYRFRNQDGDWLYDLHLNGGTYNLGHRHPELISALIEGIEHIDVGNHHFPSGVRARFASELLATQNFNAHFVSLTTSGSEAIDLAVKCARYATKRRKVVSIDYGYHGRSGISGCAGDDSAARYFLSDAPGLFLKIPFNDTQAAEAALTQADIACLLIETIPATYGFPTPDPEYLKELRAICKKAGVLFVADEVQTGLGRSGQWWATEHFDALPDMLVTSKGLAGGLYPMAALLMTEQVGNWLRENGWGYVSTFGGSEIGCHVASKVLEITNRAMTWERIARVAKILGNGLRDIMSRNDYLTEIRQTGLIMGLKFDHPEGALHAMKALIDEGIWAIFAGFDLSILQFKPGLLLTDEECADILLRVERAFKSAALRRNEIPIGVKA